MKKHANNINGLSFQNGFTLIELMVVIAIIGVLMAVAVPQYGNYLDRASLTACEGELASFRNIVLTDSSSSSLSQTADANPDVLDDFDFNSCDIEDASSASKEELAAAFIGSNTSDEMPSVISTRGADAGSIKIKAGNIMSGDS